MRHANCWVVGEIANNGENVFYLNCMVVRHEFENSQPAMTTIPHPASTKSFCIEQHLLNFFIGSICISSKTYMSSWVIWACNMTWNHHLYIEGRLHQLFENCLNPYILIVKSEISLSFKLLILVLNIMQVANKLWDTILSFHLF